MVSPVPTNIGLGKHMYAEVLIMGLVYLAIFLVAILIAIFTRQQTIIFLSFIMLFIAILAATVYFFHELVFIEILRAVLFIDVLLEIGLIIYRLIILGTYCGGHNGCLEAWIPYALMLIIDIVIVAMDFLWEIQLQWMASIQAAVDKLGSDPGKPIKREPPTKLTPQQIMRELVFQETGEYPPPIDQNELVRRVSEEMDMRPTSLQLASAAVTKWRRNYM